MLSKNNAGLKNTSNGAAFFALLCLIPIFIVIVTYGWGRILMPILPIGSPYDAILAYIGGIFLACVGVVLAKLIAADRIQVDLEPEGKNKLAAWVASCWAYILVLLVISALGTARTIFTISQAPAVLSEELSETGSKLRDLQIQIETLLKTPEYDKRAAEFKATRAKMESTLGQFEAEMLRVREQEVAKLETQRSKVESLWIQYKSEVENAQNCGVGPEALKRFKELQDVLKGLTPMSGSSTDCKAVEKVLKQTRDRVDALKESQYSLAQKNCGMSSAAAQRYAELQSLLPALSSVPSGEMSCDKSPALLTKQVDLVKTAIAKVDVPEAEVPASILAFKKKATKDIQTQIDEIEDVVVNSGKIVSDVALPVLRKSWELYRKTLAEAESLAEGKKMKLARDIKKEEVENIENLSNILRILAARWDKFMTYLTIFAAVLLDLILIAFFRRHLSSGISKVSNSPYAEYASGDNIFKN